MGAILGTLKRAAAAPVGAFKTFSEKSFYFKANPEAAMGFNFKMSKFGKTWMSGGIIGASTLSAVDNAVTPPAQYSNQVVNGDIPSYDNGTNADGDLTLSLYRNR